MPKRKDRRRKVRFTHSMHVMPAQDDPVLVAWARWLRDANLTAEGAPVVTKQAELKFVVLVGLLTLGFDGGGYEHLDQWRDVAEQMRSRRPDTSAFDMIWLEIDSMRQTLAELPNTIQQEPPEDIRKIWQAIRSLEQAVNAVYSGIPTVSRTDEDTENEELAAQRAKNIKRQFDEW